MECLVPVLPRIGGFGMVCALKSLFGATKESERRNVAPELK